MIVTLLREFCLRESSAPIFALNCSVVVSPAQWFVPTGLNRKRDRNTINQILSALRNTFIFLWIVIFFFSSLFVRPTRLGPCLSSKCDIIFLIYRFEPRSVNTNSAIFFFFFRSSAGISSSVSIRHNLQVPDGLLKSIEQLFSVCTETIILFALGTLRTTVTRWRGNSSTPLIQRVLVKMSVDKESHEIELNTISAARRRARWTVL